MYNDLITRLRNARILLKSGDYDGADLMQAWCAMADAADRLGEIEWRPIDSAPKDGSWIMGCVAGLADNDRPFVPAVVHWDEMCGWTDNPYEFEHTCWAITHWCPLPGPLARPPAAP